MNKKQLRGLIKECFIELIKEGNLLTEKFASKRIQMIHKKLKRGDTNVFQKLHNSHGIAWDQVEDKFVSKGADTSTGINFFFINSDKTNPWAKDSWDQRVYGPNLIGVTMGKSVIYHGDSYLTSDKSGRWGRKGQVGVDAKEMNNFKRFNTLADEVWNIDHKAAAAAHGTADKQENRKEAKAGATALLKAKDIAAKNKTRYEKTLRDRLEDSKPGDQVIKMVDAVHAEYQKMIALKFKMLKKGKVGDTWHGYVGTIASSYDRIMRDFEYFMQEENNMIKGRKKDKEKGGKDAGRWSEEKYYKDRMINYVREIQKEYKEMKQKIKKLDMEKQWFPINR